MNIFFTSKNECCKHYTFIFTHIRNLQAARSPLDVLIQTKYSATQAICLEQEHATSQISEDYYQTYIRLMTVQPASFDFSFHCIFQLFLRFCPSAKSCIELKPFPSFLHACTHAQNFYIKHTFLKIWKDEVFDIIAAQDIWDGITHQFVGVPWLFYQVALHFYFFSPKVKFLLSGWKRIL